MADHLHNFWTDSANSSTTTCAAAGSHYDPFLACGPSSDNGAKLCTTLGRTAAQGYTYGCSATSFAAGYYSSCEVGDLSGKFGRMMPVGLGKSLLFKGENVDPFPPLVVDYNAADVVSGSQWASIVVHCPADNSRLVCAQLIKSN